jgi:AmmeMemoRadiSam system protein A
MVMSLPQPDLSQSESGEFTQDERKLLLRLAHESILSAPQLSGNPDSGIPDPPSAHLAEPRGVFTSLYLSDELRGCVGYALPLNPLYRAVAETARAAAFEDTRFHPVSREEAESLQIELSILTPPQQLAAEAIEVGRHGLLITRGTYRGLLLPQVPVEYHWDRVTFLEQTCRKAGLPLNAWKESGTKIEAFMAEVFGDATKDSN